MSPASKFSIIRDLKLDACIDYANANFKTPTLKTPELEIILLAFRYNVSRVRHLMIMPASIGHTAMEFQRHLDMASVEIEGSLANTDDPSSLEISSAVGERAIELHNSKLAKDSALLGTPQWDPFVFQTHKIGAIPVNMMARNQRGITSFEPLLSSFIIGSWTAFETMAGDLWEIALNLNPGGLAHLSGTASRLRKNEKAPLGSTKSPKVENQSKSVELNLIQFHKFDLRHKMGTILRNRYEFSRLSQIREAYAAAFDKDHNQIDATLKDNALDALSVVRNVLVHKAGKPDDEYLRRAKNLKNVPTHTVLAGNLSLDGEIVVGLIKPALVQASQLLRAVDEWLHKHKPT
jgi:hypothetical protein